MCAASTHNDEIIPVGPSGSIFDWGYPRHELQLAAASYVSRLKDATGSFESATDDTAATNKSLIAKYKDPSRSTSFYLGAEYAKTLVARAAKDKKQQSSPRRDDDSDIRYSMHGGSDTSASTKTVCSRYDHSRAKEEAERWTREGIEPPIMYEQSFIKRRAAKNSAGEIKTGPEALYGRHNISIMMSRSLGDKFGPRSCIATPEISACTIPTDSHVRFVLGTDGLWDVVSIDDVRRIGLQSRFKDPRLLASHLAEKAVRRRLRARMRMDDISVIVVDVNPDQYQSVNSGNGGEERPRDSDCNCTIA
jgi:hypothetical protein